MKKGRAAHSTFNNRKTARNRHFPFIKVKNETPFQHSLARTKIWIPSSFRISFFLCSFFVYYVLTLGKKKLVWTFLCLQRCKEERFVCGCCCCSSRGSLFFLCEPPKQKNFWKMLIIALCRGKNKLYQLPNRTEKKWKTDSNTTSRHATSNKKENKKKSKQHQSIIQKFANHPNTKKPKMSLSLISFLSDSKRKVRFHRLWTLRPSSLLPLSSLRCCRGLRLLKLTMRKELQLL